MKMIEVRSVSKSFGKKHVLKDINFHIGAGEVVALVGPNGVGKTTLMKIIVGLLEQDAGQVLVDGIELHKDRIQYLSMISSIIEAPSLYQELSGYDNMNFVRKIRKISMDKMESMIEFIGIADDIHHKVKTYSLGMKQRLALGIALFSRPKLLILDEPTNGLDPTGVMEFRDLLIKCANEYHMAILISSHILAELDKISTSILFMRDGIVLPSEKLNDDIILQTITISANNIDEVFSKIKDISFIENVKLISQESLTVSIQKNHTKEFILALAQNDIVYEEIQINSETFENKYQSVYQSEVEK